MSAEDYEPFKLLAENRRVTGEERRERAKKDYLEAQVLAQQYGMELKQFTEFHYQLRNPTGYMVNLYPGNQRIYHDPHHKGPFLEVSEPWTLVQAVRAAIEHERESV